MRIAEFPPKCGFRPSPLLQYEPMFVFSKQIKERLLDAADLVIDFATLGEYGLEPVIEEPVCRPAPCARAQARRSTAPRSIASTIS